jgi:hypothetical protein
VKNRHTTSSIAITILLSLATALCLNVMTVLAQQRSPTTLYVSPNGSGADGRSEETAFNTIGEAVDQLVAGDTVLVMNGTYTEPDFKAPIAYIAISGRPDAWITFKAYPGHRPKIKSRNITALRIVGASYIVIDGFDIEGSRDEVSPAEADRILCDGLDTSELVNKAQGNGIEIVADYDNEDQISHHIIVRNNRVYRFGGNGIESVRADYITVENNAVYENAFFSPFDTSGITLYQQRDLEPVSAGQEGKTVKNFIRGNIAFRNENKFGFAKGFEGNGCDRSAGISDGNGIIIDDFRNTQGDQSTKRPYGGRTLVENNIVYDNGGRGINVFSSNHVDVVNNTSYKNGRTGPTNADIASDETKDVRFLNNIIYARSDRKANSVIFKPGEEGDRTTVRYDNNLVFGSSDFDEASGGNNITGRDPELVNAADENFALRDGSPAIDSGVDELNGLIAPAEDQQGVSRPQRGGIDIGALEFVSAGSMESKNRRVLQRGVKAATPRYTAGF